jgi:hypothetical protein
LPRAVELLLIPKLPGRKVSGAAEVAAMKKARQKKKKSKQLPDDVLLIQSVVRQMAGKPSSTTGSTAAEPRASAMLVVASWEQGEGEGWSVRVAGFDAAVAKFAPRAEAVRRPSAAEQSAEAAARKPPVQERRSTQAVAER